MAETHDPYKRLAEHSGNEASHLRVENDRIKRALRRLIDASGEFEEALAEVRTMLDATNLQVAA